MKTALALLLSLASPLALAAVNLSLSGLVELVVYLLIFALVIWLLLFIVGKVAPPEPFGKIITTIIYVVAALILIVMLLGFLTGSPIVNFR